MPVNSFFNNTSQTNEQDLYEDLTIESIQISGVNIKYIPREIFELDTVLQEPTKTVFDRAYLIEATIPDIASFDGGEQNYMAKFGLAFNQTLDFVIAKKRFIESVPDLERPREGDLIYLGAIQGQAQGSFSNTLFEINHVTHSDPNWLLGRFFVFRLTCETFRNSHEKIQTGVENIDQFNITEEDTQPLKEYNESNDKNMEDLLSFDYKNPFNENTRR